MRKLPNRLPSPKYQMGISKRRPWHYFSIGVKGVYQIGDHVVFLLDGAKGIVLGVKEESCHVLWEDSVCSWEKMDLLQNDDEAPLQA